MDLPGYGYASRGKKQVEKKQQIIEDYILEREQMTNLFVLIDCRLEPQKIDRSEERRDFPGSFSVRMDKKGRRYGKNNI